MASKIPTTDFELELVSGSVQAAMKAAGATSTMSGDGALYMVPPGGIRRIEGFNVRVDTPDYLKHIENLKASIKSEGFFRNKPLAGYVAKEDDGVVLYLTDGYSRFRAVEELIEDGVEIEKIPFVVKPTSQTLEDLTVALVQDNEGRPLSVYERAIVVKRLEGMGVERPRIAERLGITDRYVSDLLLLAGAPASVRNHVIKGTVSPTEAIKQLRQGGKKAGAKIEEGVKEAAKAGKKKATAKDVKAAGALVEDTKTEAKTATRKGRTTDTFVYAFKKGTMVPAAEILPVRTFRDADWWNWNDDTKTHAFIEDDIVIEVKVTYVEKDDTLAGLEDGEQTDTPADDEAAGQIEDQSGGDEGEDNADVEGDEDEDAQGDDGGL